jgi:cell division protein ZapA (FtsZ GTPase activity inhibitor)
MTLSLSLTIIFIVTALTTFAACSFLGKKIDKVAKNIERRNAKESKNRGLYRYDD